MLDMLKHVVASESDMAVVGQVGDDDLLTAAKRKRADVVLVGQKAEEDPDDYCQLLLQQPRLKVLAIAADGKTGSLYELRPRRTSLCEISAAALCKAIRGRQPLGSAVNTARQGPMEI